MAHLLIILRRLWAEKWLALAKIVGLTATVAVSICIPLYTDAVYYRVLLQKLSSRYDWDTSGQAFRPDALTPPRARSRPPFAFTFRYTGQLHGAVEWEEAEGLDNYFKYEAGKVLGLPEELLVRHFRTGEYKLVSANSLNPSLEKTLALSSFAFMSDFEQNIQVVQGNYPKVATQPGETLEVMVSESQAGQMNWAPGDEFLATPITNPRATPVPVRISGTWRPVDANEDAWFYDPSAFSELMFIPEQSFRNWLSPQVHREVSLALWYMVMNGTQVHAEDIPDLLERVKIIQRMERNFLPDADYDPVITDALFKYQQGTQKLTTLLFGFSLPVFGMLVIFIHLLSSLSVARQRNEIALLRSRGVTALQVVSLTVIEGLLLSLPSLVLGIPLALLLTESISRVRSFLDFSAHPEMRVAMTGQALFFGLAVILVGMVAQILPTAGAARQNIVSYRWKEFRALNNAWWQRMGLDFLLFAITGYGYYLLINQGSLSLSEPEASSVEGLFQNPLYFLTPTIGICAITLFVLRCFPWVMALFNWIGGRGNGISFLIATNHLARSPGLYRAPIILQVWTLSLAIFTASLALVLDRSLWEYTYYHDGADMSLYEMGQTYQPQAGDTISITQDQAQDSGKWAFLPISEHLKLPGVEAASRVGNYKAVYRMGDQVATGKFLGIDRLSFPAVAYWRSDFSRESLGNLMNLLAIDQQGVLVSRRFADAQGLQIGDPITLNVDTFSQSNTLNLRIAAFLDWFPSWYPLVLTQQRDGTEVIKEEPLFVGNLEYLFEQAGGDYPHSVWLKTLPNANYQEIVAGVQRLRLGVEEWRAPMLTIEAEQLRPERQGLFGLLSIGFIITTLMTVIGFFYYTVFYFRYRQVELGTLQAIGLPSKKVMAVVTFELVFVILIAVTSGTVLGIIASRLFIPALLVNQWTDMPAPPYQVDIAWETILNVYILFFLLLLISLVGLMFMLRRVKLFEALKMGETQ